MTDILAYMSNRAAQRSVQVCCRYPPMPHCCCCCPSSLTLAVAIGNSNNKSILRRELESFKMEAWKRRYIFKSLVCFFSHLFWPLLIANKWHICGSLTKKWKQRTVELQTRLLETSLFLISKKKAYKTYKVCELTSASVSKNTESKGRSKKTLIFIYLVFSFRSCNVTTTHVNVSPGPAGNTLKTMWRYRK